MSVTEFGDPGLGGGGPGARGWPTWVKLIILLAILVALGWVLMLATQYLRTKQPLSQLPGVPEPIGGLFDRPSFQYVRSITGLANPTGVAVGQDGRVYVTDSGGQRTVHIFNSEGQELGSFAPPTDLAPSPVPVYVAVSPLGDVYVSDRGVAEIFIFSPDGTYKGKVNPPAGYEDWHPLGLTFDAGGDLYVTDVTPDNHRVVVLDQEGNLRVSFGKQGEGVGEFSFPNGIAVDSSGRIFVADGNNGRMQAFDKDGNYLFMISRGMSPGDLSMPRGIAVDKDNRLIIADTSRGGVQAYILNDSSNEAPLKYLGSFSGDPGSGVAFQFPNGLALDGHGNIWVTDRANGRVQEWSY
jgi:DNA-binding beta-propeller fold protein YncE